MNSKNSPVEKRKLTDENHGHDGHDEDEDDEEDMSYDYSNTIETEPVSNGVWSYLGY